MTYAPLRGLPGDWSDPISAGDDYAGATAAYAIEDYQTAVSLLERHVLGGGAAVSVAQPLVRFDLLVEIYCWGLYQLKRFEALESVLERAAAEGPSLSDELVLVWCRLKLQTGEFESAFQMCRRFVDENRHSIPPIMGRYLFALAVAQFKLGDIDEAISSLEASYALATGYSRKLWMS